MPSLRNWSVKATCPHGRAYNIEFEPTLGYLMRPKDCTCDAVDARVAASPPVVAPSRLTVWRETRRLRKELRKAHQWPWS